MGHILDIVPNHVGIMGADNAWWMDVLQNGRASRYAEYFDIDWEPADPALAGKLLVPVLGDTYGAVLERGELQLRFEAAAEAYRRVLPRAPLSHRPGRLRTRAARCSPAAPRPSADALHELLERQAYRLAYWRVAADEINYRRFFDINDLAALRMENAAVFEATHRLIFELLRDAQARWPAHRSPGRPVRSRAVFSPAAAAGHRRRLRRRRDAAVRGGGKDPRALSKSCRATGRVHGTSGYMFANNVQGLCVDGAARGRMDRIYRAFLGEPIDWARHRASIQAADPARCVVRRAQRARQPAHAYRALQPPYARLHAQPVCARR